MITYARFPQEKRRQLTQRLVHETLIVPIHIVVAENERINEYVVRSELLDGVSIDQSNVGGSVRSTITDRHVFKNSVHFLPPYPTGASGKPNFVQALVVSR